MPATLRVGSMGPDVRQLQKALNRVLDLTPPLPEDGVFGQGTLEAVKRFQREEELPLADGVVGPQTWAALASEDGDDPPTALCRKYNGLPDTTGWCAAERYNLYVAILRKAKGHVCRVLHQLDCGHKVLLGLRVTTNTRARCGRGIYDDRIVVLWKHHGCKHAHEFVANTEPSSYYEDGYAHAKKALGRDADGDGRKDLGRLPEGVYCYGKSCSDKFGHILRPWHSIRAERDVNHDGVFDARDAVLVTHPCALDSGKHFIFHRGGVHRTASAGGQTLPPWEWERFWKALGGQSRFEYVLVKVC